MISEKRFNELEKAVEELQGRRRQQDFAAGSIKQRFLEAHLIFRGLDADKPTDGNKSERYFYFATDTNTLYAWNGTSYVSEVLT